MANVFNKGYIMLRVKLFFFFIKGKNNHLNSCSAVYGSENRTLSHMCIRDVVSMSMAATGRQVGNLKS